MLAIWLLFLKRRLFIKPFCYCIATFHTKNIFATSYFDFSFLFFFNKKKTTVWLSAYKTHKLCCWGVGDGGAILLLAALVDVKAELFDLEEILL